MMPPATRGTAMRVPALAGALLATWLSQPAWAVTVADGQAALERHDYATARTVWTALAEAGDADAAFDLGVMCDLGVGGDPDPAAALRWYRMAAGRGHAEAAFNVAVMLDAGRGTASDLTEAATWYATAAVRGHARAAFNLAQLYATGSGVPRNPALADAWFRAAARGGILAAVGRSAPRLPAGGDTPAGVASEPDPVLPRGDTPVNGDPPAVALVWRAAAQPHASRFFVQVLALEDARPRPVFSGYTDISAMLVRLPRDGTYVWRVYEVPDGGGNDAHYAAGHWSRFVVPGPIAPHSTSRDAPPGLPGPVRSAPG